MDKYVIFDFDGTIVDSKKHFFNAFKGVPEKYGFRKIHEDEMDFLSSMSVKVSLAERYRLLGIPLYKLPLMLIQAPRMTKEVRANLRRGIAELKEFEGIREVVSGLKRLGYKLAIISTNSASNIAEFLQKNHIKEFEGIYPSKGLFGKYYTIKRFLRKMKIKKEDMIYIGDELRDIFACKKVGVKIIAVSWGLNSINVLKEGNPDHIASTPIELIDMVNSFFGREEAINLK